MKRRKKLQKFQSFVSYLHYLEIIAYLSNKSTKSPLRPLGAHLATFSENVVANKKISLAMATKTVTAWSAT